MTQPSDPGPPDSSRKGASRKWDMLYGMAATAGLPILLHRRFIKGKDKHGRKEKWGHVADRPAHPKRIWIHAVSVGEAQASTALVRELKAQIPDSDIVVSTTTPTGQEVARQRFGSDAVFYFPYDFSKSVRRCFDHVKPALIVLMELEVWPNLTREALARDIPVVVVNARITQRSSKRYKMAWRFLGGSFKRVRKWLAQNDEYAERLRWLGVEPQRIEISGNVKYDNVDTRPIQAEDRAVALNDLALPADARVIFGGSIHPTEEVALLDAFQALQPDFSHLRLVLCPRHPERLAGVEKEILARGLPCLRRSTIKEKGGSVLRVMPEEDRARAVLLIDTMGELNRLYKAAEAVFVGGSLIPHGGQSVMEPAGMGLPTVYGPHMFNFTDAVEILKACDGSRQIQNASELKDALEQMLKDPETSRSMGERARTALVAKQGASKVCAAYLAGLLKK
jgi:3-deoxy-D-manno-octulosonic-acid transferase